MTCENVYEIRWKMVNLLNNVLLFFGGVVLNCKFLSIKNNVLLSIRMHVMLCIHVIQVM